MIFVEEFFIGIMGFIIGGIIFIFVGIAFESTTVTHRNWKDAIDRGYAEYCTTTDNIVWKGECK